MSETEFLSAVTTVKASDGTEFDILRIAPENAANLRGDALVAMRKIAQEREPELLPYLQTHQGLSSEYAMSSGLIHSKKPGVKADLLTVMVDENIAEGHRSHAIDLLAYANAVELPVADKYGERFVADQYGAAMQEENYFDAWMIAEKVKSEGDKITRRDWPKSAEWDARERSAFERYADKVLADVTPEADPWDNSTWELQMLFDTMRFRDDGFSAETPSELSRRVADKYIQLELRRGRKEPALRLAIDANMPPEYIARLGGQVEPKGIEKILRQVEATRNKVFGIFRKG